jgi:methyltransferase family protein
MWVYCAPDCNNKMINTNGDSHEGRDLLAEKDRIIRSLSDQLQEKKKELDRIHRSLGWRLLSIYGRFKYSHLLPLYKFLHLMPFDDKSTDRCSMGSPSPDSEGLNPQPSPQVSFPPKFQEHELAHLLLDGLRGLEIGAASHNPFGLNSRNVAPQEGSDFYGGETRRLFGIEPALIDICAYADNIPVPEKSEDFILSSHVVEHLPDVISTFIEWNRIVRDGGYIFMILPLRTALPDDVPRELTAIEHFISDYQHRATLDSHPTDGVPGGRMGHYHTFTPRSLMKIVKYMRVKGLCRWTLISREDVDTKLGNGFTLVFRVNHNKQSG